MLIFSEGAQPYPAWWASSAGRLFLTSEQVVVKTALNPSPGALGLVLGEAAFLEGIRDRGLTSFWVHPRPFVDPTSEAIQSRQDKLPIASNSLDWVYLAHCLEEIHNPHEALRESYRVLKPRGQMVIGCFNPWSLWGLWRWAQSFKKPALGSARVLSKTQLKNWLYKVGLEVTHLQVHCFKWPIYPLKTPSYLKPLASWERFLGAGGYVMVAIKQEVPLTPLRAQWHLRCPSPLGDLIEPARCTPPSYEG